MCILKLLIFYKYFITKYGNKITYTKLFYKTLYIKMVLCN